MMTEKLMNIDNDKASERTLIALTLIVNDYNQHGEYLIAVFDGLPTFEALKKVLNNEDNETIDIILNGKKMRSDGYFLSTITLGELF